MSEQPAETAWQRLDRRTVHAAALLGLGVGVVAGVPTTIGVAANNGFGVALAWVLPCVLLLIAAAAGAEALRWRAHRYRLTGERLELTFDLLVHTRRTIRLDRIRTVDVTANPLYRIFGLAELTAGSGTGSGDEERLRLVPLRQADADRLRRELLRRAGTPADHEAGPELSTLDWSWARYAPVSFLAPALGIAAFGVVLQLADWFGLQQTVIDRAIAFFATLPLVVTILLLLAAVLVIGTVGSLGIFVEMWANYRLEREPGGTLRVRRGLLTTRSVSVEESRLRGVELVQPLGNRLSGAARVDAIAVGMRAKQEDQRTDYRTLLPAAPRAVADGVVTAVLRENEPPTAVPLRAHPLAARRRRVIRAVLAALAPAVVLAVLGMLFTSVLLHVAWISAVLLLPIAVALALDAYRGLGHALTDEYLVIRAGSIRRGTVALRRSGIIGWTIQQSAFQRHSRLYTLVAITAAGRGGYCIRDVAEQDGVALIRAANPEIIAQFTDASGAIRA